VRPRFETVVSMSDTARSDTASASFAPRLVFPPGTVVEGKYRIERGLGQGVMGCVFLATHLHNGESLALKFMHPADPSQGPAAFAAFLHAARSAARFRSENVAHVRDMGMLEDGAPFLVMEYLEGGTLDTLIHARGALPVALSVDLAMQAARGLGDAHAAGVIHRDIRPSNLFLARIPNGATNVKLLDFGGSRLVPRPGNNEDRRSPAATVVETFPYTAPEQIQAPNDVDGRADIWSIGVVLYEMLAGAPPFRDETLDHMRERVLTDPPASLGRARSDVPVELEAAVMRCLEKKPEDRFPEMADLTLALAPFRATERRSGPPRASARPSPLPPPMTDAPVAVPTPSEATPPESAHMAIVAPIVAPIAAPVSATVADSTRRPTFGDRLRERARTVAAKPRGPLVAAAGALLVAVALVSAAATSGSETSSNANAERAHGVAGASVPVANATNAAPAATAAPSAAPTAAETSRTTAEPEQAAEPAPVPLPVPPTPSPPPRAMPEPPTAAPQTAAATSVTHPATTKAPPSGGTAPVGTAGFGERE
jgi:eukaryotic-like serine/threonine-protein kinase